MIQAANIPAELTRVSQWVCWRYVDRGPGLKPEKRPINPKNDASAGVQWPNTWTQFKTAYSRIQSDPTLNGLGFVLTPGDPFVAVDIDDCLSWDGDFYQLSIDAQSIVETLYGYTEISPSRRGLHILCRAPGFRENHKSADLEIYSHSRFVTITGRSLDWCPASIETRSTELGEIMSRYFPSKGKATPKEPHVVLSNAAVPADDDALWMRIFNSKPKLRAIFNGDLSAIPVGNNGEPDQSHAVILLLNTLAFWTGGNAAQMRRMMGQTYLNKSKWETRRGNGDWLDYEIRDALQWNTAKLGTKK